MPVHNTAGFFKYDKAFKEIMEKLQAYNEFLRGKILTTPQSGFEIKDDELHPILKPHQRDTVKWAAVGGRRAIFASFGMGKTIMQLEWARHCIAQHGGRALIVCPLGVKQEFKKDAQKLGINIEYVKTRDEAINSPFNILITNYERVRDGDINPKEFTCTSLDEAAVLRDYGSKTYQEFLTKFAGVRYKLVCTATPSPNKYKELIHYAGYLEIMDTGQALTRFFKRDSQKANNLTLYPHKEREFWLWMSGWAMFLTKPSDLGYTDEGYSLPELNVVWHCLRDDAKNLKDADGQTKLVKDRAIGLSAAAKEKRESATARLQKVKDLVNGNDDHWIIWHHLEYERELLEGEIEGIKTVYGSQNDDVKERLLIDFSEGNYRVLGTKSSIAGQGCNFQYHCHNAVYMGINYEFADFIQAIHRIHRFQQDHQCNIHIIYTESEENIRKELERKWQQHYTLVDEMTGIIKEYGLSHSKSADELTRAIGIERREYKGQNFTAVNNDNVPETISMPDNSMHMILTSIPFSNHYEYTPSYNDFGHTNNDAHFFEQMDFLTPELHRVLQPGRIAAIHVKDRILFGSVTGCGFPTVNHFHAKCIDHYISHGFYYMGMITVETDVVRENNQTYRLGYTEQCKDGSKMGVGSPEYILLFRKAPSDTSDGYADLPVTKEKADYRRGQWQIDARAKWNSSGNRLLTPDEISNLDVQQVGRLFSDSMAGLVYDFKNHIELANAMDDKGSLPATFELLKVPARSKWVWSDIIRMRTLNMEQSKRNQENHICPLQLDLIERLIVRYTNEGETVYDPFGGLMSVPYVAIKNNRKGYGVELNPGYYNFGVGYCREAEITSNMPTLFDTIPEPAA